MKKSILISDDSTTMQQIIGNTISSLGYEPICAMNGLAAFELAKRHKDQIVLIILDLNMPVMDGMSTLTKLKHEPELASIPVMIVTVESDRSKIVDAVKAGAKNYLIKPFTQQDLATKILTCMGKGMTFLTVKKED